MFLNFLNRRCISSMLFYFTKIFLNYLFYVILFYKDISQLPQPHSIFLNYLNRILFYKDISQLPLLCYSILQRYFSTTSTAALHSMVCHADMVCHAWRDYVAHPPARAPGVCEGSEWNHIPIACISKYVIERTMAKCKLYQQIKRHF